jgi:MFS family permease
MVFTHIPSSIALIGAALAPRVEVALALLLVRAALSQMDVPTRSAYVMAVVTASERPAAASMTAVPRSLAAAISPALAGAMVGWFGASSCYYLDTLSFIFSAAMIATLVIAREPVAPSKDSHPLKSVLSDLLAGLKFIFTHPTISFVILAMAAGMFAVSCFGPLIAVYVRDELQANSVAFGIINSMIGVGMIGGTLLISRFGKGVSKTRLALWGLFTMGGFVVVMAAFKTIAAASAGMFGLGVGVLFVIVSAQTIMQGQTPMEMIGRVSSSFMSVLSIAQLVGLVISGSLAQALGIRTLFFASAAMLFLITLLGYFRLPQQAGANRVTPQEQSAD